MKIAILTQPLNTNYGGILQAFALQTVLLKMGHEVLVVDLPVRRTWYGEFKGVVKSIIKRFLLRQISSPIFPINPTLSESKLITQHTQKFIQENIITTHKIHLVERLSELKKYHFNAYIVGSDQVWRPRFSPGISAFFLDFLRKETGLKRIAYAASFGVDYWEFNNRQTEKCKILIQRFDAISVREDSGVQLCKKHLGVDVIQMVDPTMLLNKEKYISLIKNERIHKKPESAMVYILDKTVEKELVIEKVVQHFNLSINSVMPLQTFSQESRKHINDCIFPPVYDWLQGFMESSFVVTDSFHGTVFSIIFNKPFLVIGNKERGMTRFISLLTLYGLEKRLVSSVNDLSSEFLNNPIDFRIINKIREEQQEKAYAFLLNALKT